MQNLKFIVLVILFYLLLASCKKNNDVTVNTIQQTARPASSQQLIAESFIKGVWEGTYIPSTKSESLFLSFDIKPAGVLNVLNDSTQIIGTGTWALNDTIFNAYYIIFSTQHVQSVSGELHVNTNNLGGNWQYNNTYEDGGTWNMNKI